MCLSLFVILNEEINWILHMFFNALSFYNTYLQDICMRWLQFMYALIIKIKIDFIYSFLKTINWATHQLDSCMGLFEFQFDLL